MSSSAFGGASNGGGAGSGFSIDMPGVSSASSSLGGLVSAGSGVTDDLSSQVLDGSVFGEIGSGVAAANSSMQEGLSNGLSQTMGVLGTTNDDIQQVQQNYAAADTAVASGFGGVGSAGTSGALAPGGAGSAGTGDILGTLPPGSADNPVGTCTVTQPTADLPGQNLYAAPPAAPPPVSQQPAGQQPAGQPDGQVTSATVGVGPGAVSVSVAQDSQNTSVTVKGLVGDMLGASVSTGPGSAPPTGAFLAAQGSVGQLGVSAQAGTAGASVTGSVPTSGNPGVSEVMNYSGSAGPNGLSGSVTPSWGAGTLAGAGAGAGFTIRVPNQTLDAIGKVLEEGADPSQVGMYP